MKIQSCLTQFHQDITPEKRNKLIPFIHQAHIVSHHLTRKIAISQHFRHGKRLDVACKVYLHFHPATVIKLIDSPAPMLIGSFSDETKHVGTAG